MAASISNSSSLGCSPYVASLDSKARQRYLEKLSCVGLTLEEDPYYVKNESKYQNDLTTWPKIEYGHIFGYFVKRPGIYTQEQLLSWKQLDAYNYFQAGFVRTVFSSCFGRDKVILKAKVNPSQKSPDQAHEAWLVAMEIFSLHCTCMAG